MVTNNKNIHCRIIFAVFYHTEMVIEMKKIDNIRNNQTIRQNKKEKKRIRKEKSNRRRSTGFKVYVTLLKILVVLFVAALIGGCIWIYNQIDFSFGDDFTAFDMQLSSTIYCKNEYGEYEEYEQFKSSEKRIWVDIEDVPKDLQDAFVAIEDQRFYKHKGMDIKRTLGAVINVFVKGDSSYGGSTITQQLVKNITNDNERTGARKIREITRALVLETKMEKSDILEMYMNSIYLSQGVHGVQAASNVYFGKDVADLTLAESACIAGITQYPTTYDPIINPKNNKKKQLVVLAKMLELGFITESEYNSATAEKLEFTKFENDEISELNDNNQSYFADYIFEQAKADLMAEFEYTDQFAENLLCNGGLKIYATVDRNVQNIMEDYFENDANFPKLGRQDIPQSAMIVIEPSSGELKGIIGGRGKKEGMRVLNRATQSKRQPGSSIKPIAVYAPALEENIINLSSYIANAKITMGSWTPKNSNGRYTGPVTVKNAVAYSYNIPAINVLKALTVEKSFDYMKDKLHCNSLIDEVERNGKEYSDKTLASLALGGLTDGVTPLEMTAAYSSLANGGVYIEPSSYTKIFDRNEKLFFERKPAKNKAFSEETAFLTQQLLKNVVKYGTASGNTIGQNDTCGKTGTTDDNKDKWFIGFTPHYCAGVWFGYDKPQVISTGSNPSVSIWRNIMTSIHSELDAKKFDKPDGIVKAKVCPYTGLYESSYAASEYANKKFLTGYCGGKNHSKYIGWTKDALTYSYGTTNKKDDEKKEDKTDKTDKNDTGSKGETSSDQTNSSPSADNGSHDTPSTAPESAPSGDGQSGGSSQAPAVSDTPAAQPQSAPAA